MGFWSWYWEQEDFNDAPAKEPKVKSKQRRVKTFTIEEIMPLIKGNRPSPLCEYLIKFDSTRLQTFRKSTSCAHCGLEGAYFALDIDKGGGWHLNFYATNSAGVEVMLTSDHIVPRSRGGRNWLSNRQTMCQPCNAKKGCRLEEELSNG